MAIRRQLVLAYVVLRLGDVVVFALSDELAVTAGLSELVVAVAIAVGLWRGSHVAWRVAVAFEMIGLALLVLLLTVPWSAGVTALVILKALRVAILLQRPLREPVSPPRQQTT